MRVQVDWYKAYGKWYGGTVVDIGDVSLVDSVRFKQAIVDNQGELVDSWVEDEFFVVVNNLPGDWENPDVKFAMVLFKPGAFAGMKPKGESI